MDAKKFVDLVSSPTFMGFFVYAMMGAFGN